MDKVPKKITTAKVRVVKKPKGETEVFLPVKKISIKKLPVSKSQAKVKSAKRLPIKKVISKARPNSDEIKLVPGTISVRLLEKRKLYERLYHNYVPKVMRPIAITGGYAYVTVGIFLALLMANPSLANLVSQSASVLCFTGNCEIATSTESGTNELIKPVEFKPLPPIVSGFDTNLQLVRNVDIPVRLTILPINGGEALTISGVTESATNIVNFLLPTAKLSNGSYLLQAELYIEETKQVRAKLVGPIITVENEIVVENTIVVENEVSTSATSSVELNNAEEVVDIDLSDEGRVLGVSSSSVNSDEGVAEVPVISSSESEIFDLAVIPGTTLNQTIFKILPTFVFERVEVAIKLKGDGETFFMGQATRADDAWIYWLDNTAIPNGSYSLIVRGFDNGEISEQAVFAFTNKVEPVLTKDIELNEIRDKVNSLLEQGMDVTELSELRSAYATSYAETSTNDNFSEYFAEYLPILDRLFASYASAITGETEAFAILADEQIEKYLDTVIIDKGTDFESETSFGQELTALVLNIKEYIQTKEAEIVKLSGGDFAFDTDKDGFTDYDEVVVYSTDPKLADTDNDGILDSVEVILGYSANNDKLEAVSRTTNRLNAGVQNGELLAISAIEPFYLYNDNSPAPEILTSVSGIGIPSSFARIYLGDKSESIIIKTNLDGTFTQTIDKAFVKFEGEVLLAITDNTGKIVMSGQPLQLDKVITSRQLFNPVAINAAVIKSVEDFKTSNIIGAVGVVSFGLILILLGKALVPRREPVKLEIA